MSDLFWLTDAQMARLEPYFPRSHGKPRVDDRRVLSGIIFINRNGLRWRDAPKEYGPHKTLYNRWKRWSEKGIFAQMMAGLAANHGEQKTVMIDATYLKAHRTATSMGVKRGAWAPDRAHQRWHEHQAARYLRQPRASARPLRDGGTSERLHRRARSSGRLAECGMAARGSRLRRRLVQRSIERQGDTRLYPRQETAEEAGEVRQTPLQTPQPDRDHVWQAERLAACGNPIRQMPKGLPVGHRAGCTCHLLAVKLNESRP